MNVVMVKHNPAGKVFWFEVPENAEFLISKGDRVCCDTQQGMQLGTAVSGMLNGDDVKGVMKVSGATFPLKKIIAAVRCVPIRQILIPDQFKSTPPNNQKLAARFLEYYHTGFFNTPVVIDQDGFLRDGYTAYLVAKKLKLNFIPVAVK